MRILVTADIHYDIARSRAAAEEAAEQALAIGGDALVIVGDIAGRNREAFCEALRLFEKFPGRKWFVPGNHCLWVWPGECSLQRYEHDLPAWAAEEGFECLDFSPAELGGVGFVGSVGWYDYSLRDESLGLPLAFYEKKITPAAARYYGEHTELLDIHAAALDERHERLGARWMDGWRVNLGMSDEEFLDRLLASLETQLESLAARVDRVVAFVHHLPVDGLVPPGRPGRFAFAMAYMGSTRIGELLSKYPQVTDVYCGHSHWPAERQCGSLRVVNVGSTYVKKQLKIINI
ncbi:MAG: hypothetical protein HN370_04085 [Phycisphaerales bacterium]|mgnify:CR=1 FL=1|jgi:predicted phosphohydrolase|nr:hypothetical protein [Phycisphaerales bacterium]